VPPHLLTFTDHRLTVHVIEFYDELSDMYDMYDMYDMLGDVIETDRFVA